MGGEVGHGLGENPHGGVDLLGGDAVGYIYELDVRADAQDHAFHYPDITIVQAEVGR